MPAPSTLAAAEAAAASPTPESAIPLYISVLTSPEEGDQVQQDKEKALTHLADLYKQRGDAKALSSLVKDSRPLLASLPKAKAAKILKSLIDAFPEGPEALELQVLACREAVEWASSTSRVFLRQQLETRLISLLLASQAYNETLTLVTSLLRELKRLDDKMTLVEVHLLESRAFHALRNLPKARAASTAARTNANSIYVPPILQAELDLQSGLLLADERDFRTAFSYFIEAMEAFNTLEDPRVRRAIKYMLLCKVMQGTPEDVSGILASKPGTRWAGPGTEAMTAVAEAGKDRSLEAFEKALSQYGQELREDPVVRRHLSSLYDTLLEGNVLRCIEPYERVEVAHLAKLLKLPLAQVESKLSQMILDKQFYGVLDQGAGCLIVHDKPTTDQTYEATLTTLKHMGDVVDSLYEKAAKLT
ncbi:hypothetical protein BJ684DRAFT_22552 [Piptocephalis cylindrospora]|uniref:PCI domain-containing protein n=1 Tax=Piptocephalis cylindrospora TaxID=1907219 RepID=A0A4P9Y620_9FUNG|nr:hypothetical protein BJ684DRAFT_22552 [Piptocephalis cylindrospora]|eukprot:RKP14403.1 hypothetical protein BJ684DRAFT_22552 [Piptocephalis cylindrospora]